MTRALDGVRIADFSHVMAGPFATHFLAALGADVVKVEPPGIGDPMRRYGADRRYDGMAPGFIAANCGKRSIVLDLKQEAGLAAARRLIASSDIVLENFRPGVMARLGLGYDVCRTLKPDIIFCSVSGYGQDGPMRDYPAIDNIVQATSGLMSLTGDPDGDYMRIGFPAVDTYTGTLAALAMMAALLRRNATGEGQHIDVAMLDSTMVLMASAVVPFMVTGRALERTGNTGYSGQPTAGMFYARDGERISLGVVQPHQYERLCQVLGRVDLLDDPRFLTPDLRREHRAALTAELQREFLQRGGAEWEALLSEAGVPCGVMRNLAQAMNLPGLAERGVVAPVHISGLPDREDVSTVGAGFRANADGPQVSTPPPRLGQHTREILSALGYSAREVEELVRSGGACAE